MIDYYCFTSSEHNSSYFKTRTNFIREIMYRYNNRGGSRISSYGGGAHLKKLRRAEGGAEIFGVFRVKNHDFTPKNLIFYNCGGRRENFWVFCVKNHDFTPKNHIFSNFRGGARRVRPPPPWIRPWIWHKDKSIDGCFDWQKEKEKGEVMDKAWNKHTSLKKSYGCVV